MRFSVTEQALLEPLTLDEAKTHLRVEHDEEDDLIASLISAARHYVEAETGRSLLPQKWTGYADNFADIMPLRPNLISVDAVRYLDENNVLQVLDPSIYAANIRGHIGELRRAFGQSWPETYPEVNAVEIEFTHGYADVPANVPANFKAAMKLIIGNLYENREAVVIGTISGELPLGVDALLANFTVRNIA